MTFGEGIPSLRKKLKWTLGELVKKVGSYALIIERHGHIENMLSIKTAKNIAYSLSITLNYLFDCFENAIIEKELLKRLKVTESLAKNAYDKIYYFIDMDVINVKSRQTFM